MSVESRSKGTINSYRWIRLNPFLDGSKNVPSNLIQNYSLLELVLRPRSISHLYIFGCSNSYPPSTSLLLTLNFLFTSISRIIVVLSSKTPDRTLSVLPERHPEKLLRTSDFLCNFTILYRYLFYSSQC